MTEGGCECGIESQHITSDPGPVKVEEREYLMSNITTIAKPGFLKLIHIKQLPLQIGKEFNRVPLFGCSTLPGASCEPPAWAAHELCVIIHR